MKDIISRMPASDWVCGDDGYWVYWPEAKNMGAYSAWHLRAIADHLDALNAEWDAIVQNDPLINNAAEGE